MPPTEPGRSINAADVIPPAKPSVRSLSGRGHAWVLDEAATEDPLVKDPRLLRPATSPAAARSRDSHLRPFQDPCNYLG